MRHLLITEAKKQLREKEGISRALKYAIRSAHREWKYDNAKTLMKMYAQNLKEIAQHRQHLFRVRALLGELYWDGFTLTESCYNSTCEHLVCELLRRETTIL